MGEPADPPSRQVSYAVVLLCANECAVQQSGERSVARLVEAWLHATERQHTSPTVDDVIQLGRLVEPDINRHGTRTTPVTFADGGTASDWRDVGSQLERLVGMWRDATPNEWYRSFQDIHPFGDGNGRVGLVLHNWKAGTLTGHPSVAPTKALGHL